MDQLKQLHQRLIAKTTDELVSDEIKRIQTMLLSYFENNPLKTMAPNTNVISYKHGEDLMKNMEILAESANITWYQFYEIISSVSAKGHSELNNTDFIKKLLKLIFPDESKNPNLDLKIAVGKYYVNDYGQENELIFEFSLKEVIKYEVGVHNIVDYLLNKQKKEQEEYESRFSYNRKPKDPNVDTFQLICDQVSEKHKEKTMDGDFTLHEVNAYLTILGAFDKYDTIKYNYLYLDGDIGLDYFEPYEFTTEQQKILSQLVGIPEGMKGIPEGMKGIPEGMKGISNGLKTLQFEYSRHYIKIIFDKTNRIDVSNDILTKCYQKLEDSRKDARKELLTFVEQEKTKIIDTCIHMLKYNKSVHGRYRNKSFPMDRNFFMQSPLVSDAGIITPEVMAEVNKILGVEGFTVSIEKRFDNAFTINEQGEQEDLEPDVCNIECDTYHDSVSLAFPPSLCFPDSLDSLDSPKSNDEGPSIFISS